MNFGTILKWNGAALCNLGRHTAVPCVVQDFLRKLMNEPLKGYFFAGIIELKVRAGVNVQKLRI